MVTMMIYVSHHTAPVSILVLCPILYSVLCALEIFFVDVLYKSTFTYLLTLTAAWV